MKGSEALLRAIANVGESVPAVQFDLWVTQLLKAKLIKTEVRDDKDVFHYKLTEKSKNYLRGKGVNI